MSAARYLVLVPVLLMLLALTQAASTAQADSKITGDGTFTTTDFVLLDERVDDDETIVISEITIELTGVFVGTLACLQRDEIEPSGASEFSARCEFTGSVDGHSGTARFRVSGEAAPDGSVEGTFKVFDGEGGLEGISARGAFQGPPDGPGTYTATIHLGDGDEREGDDDDDDDRDGNDDDDEDEEDDD